MLALPPQILLGLGEEGGEPIFASSFSLQDLSASPRLHSSTYKDLRLRNLRSFAVFAAQDDGDDRFLHRLGMTGAMTGLAVLSLPPLISAAYSGAW